LETLSCRQIVLVAIAFCSWELGFGASAQSVLFEQSWRRGVCFSLLNTEREREREREMTDEGRKRATPNILVTGTPGTGKTSTCSLLASATGLRHINVGELVKEKSLHDGWDAELDCYVVNDDLVCLQNHFCALYCVHKQHAQLVIL
jgi:hypothetical protein